jgi:hypothetical protein
MPVLTTSCSNSIVSSIGVRQSARRRFTLESLCVKAPLTGDDIGSSNRFS